MVPSYFVQMDVFPLSSSGKLDRKALIIPETTVLTGKYHAPINDREEEICEIWEDVLKLERIGRHDNFFAIGGDSLSLIQVLFELQKKYDLNLQDLFEFQTIAEISSHIHLRNNKNLEFKADSYELIKYQWESALKLKDYSFSLKNVADVKDVSYRNILITGSTGFLGAYLVNEYLVNSTVNLYLLVRGNTQEEAEERIKNKLIFYFNQDLFNTYRDRIKVVNGDICNNNLGINNRDYTELVNLIDCVIHSAANVKHFGDRTQIYKVNIEGTRNISNFCLEGTSKRIFFISTVSVGLNKVRSGQMFYFTEDDIAETDNKGNVYIDSKIEGEKIVRETIEKVGGQIIRIGNLVIDSVEGKFQENKEENAFYSLLREYKERGVAPNIKVPFIDLSSVNETALGIRLLSTSNINGTFHLYNPKTVTIGELCNEEKITIIDYKDYVDNLKYGDSILTHGYYLHNVDLLGIINYNERTEFLLSILGFSWSDTDKDRVKFLWKSYKLG
jgi:surfactin family lipopeptide synthetase B